MLLRRVVAPFLQANCYVVASAPGAGALVVDPGAGSADGVARLLEALDLHVAAVLATHAHADHVWDAAAVAGGAPVYVPGPDLYRMEDPAGVRAEGEPDFSAMLPSAWVAPDDVRELPAGTLTGGGTQLIDGVPVRVVPAPGHTEGSTITLLGASDVDLGDPSTGGGQDLADITAALRAAAPQDGRPGLALAGDVVFRGSVGRTDLAGGDQEVMTWTLRTLATSLDPATVLLPGHGPATWWGRELQTNPYVRMARAN